ncbi:MAG TPA: porin [Vicinamibacterales bacterium]|nr:porin [Vicinamibacterales bacterium]
MVPLRFLSPAARLAVAAFAFVVSPSLARAQSLPAAQALALAQAMPPTGLSASAAAPAAPRRADASFRWEDHPTLLIGKNTRIAFRARVKFDERRSDAPIPDDEDTTLDLARKRIGVEGEIAGLFDFQVERELQDDDPWRDVYINYRQFDAVQVQAGKFKLPFSLDENTGATNLDFAYRSLIASHLAPGRDRGWMVHGRVANRILRYEAGVFEHDGRNARPRNPERVFGDRTIAVRVGVQPFRTSKTPLEDLLVGVAMTRSDLSGLAVGLPGLRARTPLDLEFFESDVWIKGRRERRGYEVRWRPGPVGLKAEYIKVTDERLEQSVEDTDLSPFLAKGWYVSGTVALTGEKKADGLDAPKRPFGRGGIGAVEVGMRLEEITYGSVATDDEPSTSPRADVIPGNADRVTTFGVNWYLNRWIKVQFNLIRDKITDPSQGPLPSQPTFWSRVLRFQFTL